MALTKVTGQVINTNTDVTVGVLTVTNTLAVGGTVSIGGTLTYEDVTNIDSVGLITARNGIIVGSGITLSKDGDIFFTGIATGNGSGLTNLPAANLTGTLPAISGANLTNLDASDLASGTVPTARLGSGTASSSTFLRGDSTFAAVTSTTINNNANNSVITGSGTANTLEAEANLTFTGSILTVTNNSGASEITLVTPSANDSGVYFNDGSNAGALSYVHSDNSMRFRVNATEKLRIDSSGRLLLGTTTEGNVAADDLTIATDTNTGITLRSGSSSNGNIFFSDATSGNAELSGYIQYDHSGNYMRFGTNEDERLRIDSSGNFGLGITPTCKVHTKGDQGGGFLRCDAAEGTVRFFVTGNDTSGCEVNLYDEAGGQKGILGVSGTEFFIKAPNNSAPLTFYTHNGSSVGERARITSNGNLVIGATTEIGGSGAGLQIGHASAATLFLGSAAATAGNTATIVFGPASNYSMAQVQGYAVEDGSSYANGTGGLKFWSRRDGLFTEAIRISEKGNVTLAEAIDSDSAKFNVAHSGNNGLNGVPTFVSRFTQATDNQGTDHSAICIKHNAAKSGQNGVAVLFLNSGGTEVGKIDHGQSTTQYRTSSDYRLKENETAITDGITRIKTLKPYRFNFIAEPDKTVDGFFAHEVTAVPESISGTKDETKNVLYKDGDTIPDGKAVGDVKEVVPVYQGIDHSKLVPLLTAALQESITEIESLKARLDAAGL